MLRDLRGFPFFRIAAALCLFAFAGNVAAKPANPAKPVEPPGDITFPTQAQLGNIFTLGEKPAIEAAVESGTSVDWVINDFAGIKVDSGTAAVADHKISFSPHPASKGFYSVLLTSRSGQDIKGQARTSYAVVEPADPTKIPDAKFGVVTHFEKKMPRDLISVIVKMGVVAIRDEQSWGRVEKEKGKFEFVPTNKNGEKDTTLIDYMADVKQAGLQPLIVAAFGNNLYDAQPSVKYEFNLAPYTNEGRDGYANYCLAVLNQYKGQIKALEIWNEYNGSFAAGKAAADRPKSYFDLISNAYPKIKAAHPETKVLGGAAVLIPMPYFEKLFKLGGLQYMDAVVIHPYRAIPEGVDREIAELTDLMKRYNHGAAKPIWVTECGTYQDHSPERAGAAGYLVRLYTLMLTQPEVERIFWYLARDFQEFGNMGLVHGDLDPSGRYTPVVTYPAYSNLIHLLHDARFNQREATDPRTHVYRFDKEKQSIWVCWSPNDSSSLNFAASGAVRGVNVDGSEKELTPVGGKITVATTAQPFYIVAGPGVVSGVSETPRADTVLADSESDYSAEQGKNHWSYSYVVNNKDGSAPYKPDEAKQMEWRASPGNWGYSWFGPGEHFIITRSGGEPGVVKGAQAWTVRRWTSDRSAVVHVHGHAARGDKGDGTMVKVFLDGKVLFEKMLTPKSEADIDLSPQVEKGSRLDFVVTPGPALDTNFDNTTLRVTILTPAN